DRLAFQQLRRNVAVGLWGVSCGYLTLEPETVRVMGVVSTDCYVRDADTLSNYLSAMHAKYAAPIVLSEWGSIWDAGRQPATFRRVDQMFTMLLQLPFVVGMDYWQGVGGPGGEGVIDYPSLTTNAT